MSVFSHVTSKMSGISLYFLFLQYFYQNMPLDDRLLIAELRAERGKTVKPTGIICSVLMIMLVVMMRINCRTTLCSTEGRFRDRL